MAIVIELIRPHGWLAFALMLFANSALCYRFGGRTLFFTIPIVAVIYGLLDVRWIRSEMAKPDWDLEPDQDGVFAFGMMLRGAIAGILLFGSFVASVLISNKIHERATRSQAEDGG
jgi:hypothetical protein